MTESSDFSGSKSAFTYCLSLFGIDALTFLSWFFDSYFEKYAFLLLLFYTSLPRPSIRLLLWIGSAMVWISATSKGFGTAEDTTPPLSFLPNENLACLSPFSAPGPKLNLLSVITGFWILEAGDSSEITAFW